MRCVAILRFAFGEFGRPGALRYLPFPISPQFGLDPDPDVIVVRAHSQYTYARASGPFRRSPARRALCSRQLLG